MVIKKWNKRVNTRPTRVTIDTKALQHNLCQIKKNTSSKIIAMVKANAYGCGLAAVMPALSGSVDAFGVASLNEALALRQLDKNTPCILFQGIFDSQELPVIIDNNLDCVLHSFHQMAWLLATPLAQSITVWIKVDTGMHRLGFNPDEVSTVLVALNNCSWVNKPIRMMTHFASADHENLSATQAQLHLFNTLEVKDIPVLKSTANSAALMRFPESHYDFVRPGVMLYGVSPFANQYGQQLGLKPVMHFTSAISAIHYYPAGSKIGYGGSYVLVKDSIIAVVPVGYGDGYPRHMNKGEVWMNQKSLPIVGTISMDMLTIDISSLADTAKIGDLVELWGANLPIEQVAHKANTIAYELLCQITSRGRGI